MIMRGIHAWHPEILQHVGKCYRNSCRLKISEMCRHFQDLGVFCAKKYIYSIYSAK